MHIDKFPDAVAVVRPNDGCNELQKLKHLALHYSDLMNAKYALESINDILDERTRVNIWEYAVVKVTKCFKKSNSRFSLDKKTVFGSNPTALQVVQYFIAMRDKFIVHDDNSYHDCEVGLIIAKEGKLYNIEEVVTPILYAVTLNPENFGNLANIINESLFWITQEYDKSCTDITKRYEMMSRSDLLAYPTIKHDIKMSAEDISNNRKNT